MEAKALEKEARIDRASTKEEALSYAISAVELYMKAVKLASDENERKRLKLKCVKLLGRAEEIKQMKTWSKPSMVDEFSTAPKLLKVPVSTRKLSPREEIILLEGSKLHGSIFPAWRSHPDDSLFDNRDGDDPFVDKQDLELSKIQEQNFAGWKRGIDAFRGIGDRYGAGMLAAPTMEPTDKIDLVQDITTDCSVVASLCAAVARAERGFPTLLASIMYPFDNISARPKISRNGKYIIKLYFNGTFRQVVIDDRLPVSNSSRKVFVVDRRNPLLLWPALLEKAVMKVFGGYDFPGSNSGSDLWMMTGWIPEQIFLHSDEIRPHDMWQRIYNAYRFGDAIATLGTGRLTPQEEDGLGLAGEHDYAVLDMKEINDRHMLLVKNPWCDGTIWKEPGSGTGCLADAQWTEDLRRSLAENATLSPGTFWIEFEEVIRNFESMYLNWNPGLFKYVETYHFSWAIPTVSPPECFIHNPQYSIHSAKGGIVWVLLSRHTTTEEHRILKTSAHSKSRIENPLGFISLYVFDVGGHRVQLSDDALQRGAFVDSPQTLARLNVPASTTYTLVVAQQGLPLPKHSFTLSTFSREPIVVQMAEHPYPHSKSLEGAWTSRSAGGNAGSASYGSNPQFSITLSSSTDLALLLETDRPELPVHITIVWGGGERVSTVTGRDIIGASGDYRRGCALIKLGNVGRGKYTIVCSTFEPKQLAQFTLRVESSTICEIRPIANEAAGRLSMNLPRLRMPPGTDRMLAPISVKRLTRLRVIAKHAGGNAGGISGTRSPLKVGLEVGQGPNKRILATSGNGGFGDSPGGLRLGDSDVSPDMMGRGGVWLVIERFAGRKESEEVEVEILSDGAVEVQPWGSGEG